MIRAHLFFNVIPNLIPSIFDDIEYLAQQAGNNDLNINFFKTEFVVRVFGRLNIEVACEDWDSSFEGYNNIKEAIFRNMFATFLILIRHILDRYSIIRLFGSFIYH